MQIDGKFYVAVSQVSGLFQFDKNHASRDIKALLGGDFQLPKISSTLNPKPVNFILLKDLERVMFELAHFNPIAIELSRSLVGLSLHQLFCDGFGIKFEQED